MVQIKASTALQEDYTRNSPYHVPFPTPATSGALCPAPIFTTVADAQGGLNIFYLYESDRLSERILFNIYFDKVSNSWVKEDTGWQCPEGSAAVPGIINAARHPETGNIHVALAHSVLTATGGFDLSVHYLALGSRFTKWQSTNVSGTDSDGQPQYFSGLNLSFKEGSTPWLTISLKTAYTGSSAQPTYPSWLWIPSQGAAYKSSIPTAGFSTLWDIRYGQFPDWTTDQNGHSPSWGWYGVSNEAGTGSILRLKEGQDISFATDYHPANAEIECFEVLFPEEPSVPPALLALRNSGAGKKNVVFVTNNMYRPPQPAAPPFNESVIFGDVAGLPIWIQGALKKTTNPVTAETSLTLDVFGLFEIYKDSKLTGVELWHTQTLDGALTMGDDGAFG
jgi:hypothetical protein